MATPRPTILRREQGYSAPEKPARGGATVRGLPTEARKKGEDGGPGRLKPAWVLVARLIRPHGRRGELIAEILTDFPEKFHERPRLFLIPPERIGSRAREVGLENFWFLRSRMVMKFEGIESINEAEGLRGFEVAIPVAERAPLEAGSVYVSDLIGCGVVDLNRGGAEVGEIVNVDRDSSSTELLVVRRRGRRGSSDELLIPFVSEYVVKVDAANGKVEMRLPEGLLEINAPVTEEEKLENSGPR